MNGFIIAPNQKNVVNTPTTQPDEALVFSARVENLLNRNNVYGDDFVSNEKLTNLAATALRSYADERGFIDEVIDPAMTRVKLYRALKSLDKKSVSLPRRKHGNIPL